MNVADIKPIETKYKGYRFRSRLEARWAVFFNEINLGFEYELQGFVLPSGECYLPDFFLPSLKLSVEIKPTVPAVGRSSTRTCDGLIALGYRTVI